MVDWVSVGYENKQNGNMSLKIKIKKRSIISLRRLITCRVTEELIKSYMLMKSTRSNEKLSSVIVKQSKIHTQIPNPNKDIQAQQS